MQEIFENIYRIPIVLPNSPLKSVNSYLIYNPGNHYLMDTAFRYPECHAALSEALQSLGVKKEELNILLTHAHSDHSGMSDQFVGAEKEICISQADYEIMLDFESNKLSYQLEERFMAEGFPRTLVENSRRVNPARTHLPRFSKSQKIRILKTGDIIEAGKYRLEALLMPGHTPGHLCFWMEKEKAMFTGDHVLFDITPNITSWVGVADSLGKYMSSLRAIDEYDVRKAWPGHRESGDFHRRIEMLLEHHEQRLNEVCEIIADKPGQTAYEIASRMQWRIRANSWEEFPLAQKWFAVGEGLSHLDHLMVQGRITKQLENGLYTYRLA